MGIDQLVSRRAIGFGKSGVLQFSGEITPEIENEFRSLDHKRNPRYLIVYFTLGVATVIIAIFLLMELERSSSILLGMLLLLAVFGLFVSAFRLPQIWWRWWWPKFLSTFGRHLSCQVMPVGIRLKGDAEIIEWKYITATKQTDLILLLYLDKAIAYPIHRSMSSNVSDWEELTNLINKTVRKRLVFP